MQKDAHLEGGFLQQRRHAQLADANRRDRFEPDRLPDTGRAEVVAAPRDTGTGLFAARLVSVLPVFHPQHQTVDALPQIRSDIQGKRHVPALIVAGFLTIDPDRGAVIHRSEMQQQVLVAPLRRHLKVAAIPNHLVDTFIMDAGKLSLVGEGDMDLPVEFRIVLPLPL